jgi:hypothetical protein
MAYGSYFLFDGLELKRSGVLDWLRKKGFEDVAGAAAVRG